LGTVQKGPELYAHKGDFFSQALEEVRGFHGLLLLHRKDFGVEAVFTGVLITGLASAVSAGFLGGSKGGFHG
jgi:hypothetical protein